MTAEFKLTDCCMVFEVSALGERRGDIIELVDLTIIGSWLDWHGTLMGVAFEDVGDRMAIEDRLKEERREEIREQLSIAEARV